MSERLYHARGQSEELPPEKKEKLSAATGSLAPGMDMVLQWFARISRHVQKRDWLFGLILLAVTLLAYAPAWHGKAIWDDDKHLTRPEMRTVGGLASIWFQPRTTQQYHPMVDSLFWAGSKLWGDATFGFHLLNIILHAGAAWLLLRILRKLDVPGAWLAAAVFALHPVEVESVAWLAELKNTLSGFLFFASALAYLRFDRTRTRWDYSIVITLFVLGLFAKTIVATLPAALLLVFWWKRGKLSWNRDVRPLVPFLVLGAVSGILTGWMEQKFSGAEGKAFNFLFIERCLIAGRAFWFYLGKLLWPGNLMFINPRWNIDSSAGWQYLFPIAVLLLFLAAYLAWRPFKLRAPLAALLFFTVLVFPLIGFFNVYFFTFSFVADHFQYLPGVGIITLVCAGAVMLQARLKEAQRLAMNFIFAGMLVTLAVLTWRQCRMYAGPVTLWTTILERNPECWMAHTNLGNIELKAGNIDVAVEHYRSSMKLLPGNAKAQQNLGVAYLKKGRLVEAINCFQKTIALRPNDTEAHNNLGNALLRQKKVKEAVVEYESALKINPLYAEAHINLATILFQLRRVNEATSHLRKAVEGNPGSAESHCQLGIALIDAGKLDEGMAECQKALDLNPDHAEAHNYLGICLLHKDHTADAVAHFQKAIEKPPGNARAMANLAWVLATCPDASIRNGPKSLEMARELNGLSSGKSPLVLATVAAAYAETGRFTEAKSTAGQALQLAAAQSNPALVASLKNQLRCYETNQPYHESYHRVQ